MRVALLAHRRRKNGGNGGFRPQTPTVMGAMPPYSEGSHRGCSLVSRGKTLRRGTDPWACSTGFFKQPLCVSLVYIVETMFFLKSSTLHLRAGRKKYSFEAYSNYCAFLIIKFQMYYVMLKCFSPPYRNTTSSAYVHQCHNNSNFVLTNGLYNFRNSIYACKSA